MKFTLHANSYDWKFLPVDGATFTDSGTAPTHDAPNGSPVIDSAAIDQAAPTTGQTLTVSVTSHDPTPIRSPTPTRGRRTPAPASSVRPGETGSTLDVVHGRQQQPRRPDPCGGHTERRLRGRRARHDELGDDSRTPHRWRPSRIDGGQHRRTRSSPRRRPARTPMPTRRELHLCVEGRRRDREDPRGPAASPTPGPLAGGQR